jgi:16S rRNA processing protein RimM
MKSDLLQIATIGKAVGIWGELKLHLQCDFEDQFASGEEFTLTNGKTIKIETFNSKRSLVKFFGYSVREDAKKLTNQQLFTTKQKTKESCLLEEGQFYWFDVVGCDVYEADLLLGVVDEVERIGAVDYLIVKTSEALVEKEYEKSFYIPYIDQYVKKFDLENKKIETNDAMLLLEAI